MRRSFCLLSSCLFSGAVLLAVAPAARAACSVADMKGDFAAQPTGTIVAGPLAGPFAATGLLRFDGAGKFTGVTTSSFNGGILAPLNFVGTYTVAADCTATFFEATLALNFEGALSANKNEVSIVNADPGVVGVGLLRRIQIPGGCSAASFNGNWAFQAAGINLAKGQRYSQNARVKFDGKGGFSGVTNFSEGVLNRRNIVGNVQVTADCTFQLTYADQGTSTILFGTFFGAGDEFWIIHATFGTVITGNGRLAVN